MMSELETWYVEWKDVLVGMSFLGAMFGLLIFLKW